MKHPGKWRNTIDPFTLPYKRFRPIEILGYPHAGNDVFHLKGVANGEEIFAFLMVARQKGADIANEVRILTQLRLKTAPKVIEYCLEGEPFIVTEEIVGERLSTIFGDNEKMESLSYMEEYGTTLAKFHQIKIKANPVKDRKFFHKPSREILELLNIKGLEERLSKDINNESYCICHGDFHYANILWNEHHINGILDFELTGFGSKEFDIAWALFRRPGQKFLLTKEEQQEFFKGYRKYGDFCEETVEIYMAWCYVYFLDMCRDDNEYCDYVRGWFLNEK